MISRQPLIGHPRYQLAQAPAPAAKPAPQVEPPTPASEESVIGSGFVILGSLVTIGLGAMTTGDAGKVIVGLGSLGLGIKLGALMERKGSQKN